MGFDCMIVILDWLLSNLFLHMLEEDWCRFGIDSGFHHRKWQNKSSIHPSRTTAHQLRMHKKKTRKMYSERKSVSALQSASTDVTSICVKLLE